MKRGKKGKTIRRQGALARLIKTKEDLRNTFGSKSTDPRLMQVESEISRLQVVLNIRSTAKSEPPVLFMNNMGTVK